MSTGGEKQRVTFGWQEWLGLVGVALIPLMGTLAWGVAMDRRLTVVETTQKYVADSLTQLQVNGEALRKIETRVELNSHDMESNRARIQALEAVEARGRAEQ